MKFYSEIPFTHTFFRNTVNWGKHCRSRTVLPKFWSPVRFFFAILKIWSITAYQSHLCLIAYPYWGCYAIMSTTFAHRASVNLQLIRNENDLSEVSLLWITSSICSEAKVHWKKRRNPKYNWKFWINLYHLVKINGNVKQLTASNRTMTILSTNFCCVHSAI